MWGTPRRRRNGRSLAVAGADEVGAPIEAALSRTLAGRALAQTGEADRAVSELQHAAAALEACGALRWRDEAERELRRLGHRVHRRTRQGKVGGTGIEALTSRELQVARLVVDRKTNPQIAAELFLSQKTVETSSAQHLSEGRRVLPSGARAHRRTRRQRRSLNVPARIAGVSGLLAFVTFSVAWIAGGLAQPSAYSVANDDISDLGAMTATSPWIYNQVGANLTGVLVVLLGLGLWRALSPDVIGRIGAAVLIAEGTSTFFDGIFHLDCQGIDAACDNVSWHSRAHKIESGFTAALSLLAPLILAFAFRRNPGWRDSWIPSVLTVPAVFVANAAFSTIGDGAATRAGTVVIFAWIAFVSVRLLQKGETKAPPLS